MPKLTLVLGRKTIRVYDLDQASIKVGRTQGMDVFIDNESVSREHAEIAWDGQRWVVRDLGSANGTFVNGDQIGGDQPLFVGDEIAMGKFSLFFEKVVGEAPVTTADATPQPAASAAYATGTRYIKPDDVKKMLESSKKTREAQLEWEGGGQSGTHFFKDQKAVLIGRDELCDIRVPVGPKHHLLIIEDKRGHEARNLAFFGKMKVDGQVTRKARLERRNVIEMGGLTVTFIDDLE